MTLLLAGLGACGPPEAPETPPAPAPPACADPYAGFDRFREEALERGLDLAFEVLEGMETTNVNGGVAAEDMDLDGDIDLVFGSLGSLPVVMLNDGEATFAPAPGMDTPLASAYGRSTAQHGVADVDGDGLPDLVAVGEGIAVWARNLGEARFEPQPPIWLVEDYPYAIRGTFTMGDVDGDGDLDLAMPGIERIESADQRPEKAPGGSEDIVLLQEADGSWSLAAELTPAGEPGVAISAILTDHDADGDLDLLVPNDLANLDVAVPPTALYDNLGPGPDGYPAWQNVAPEVGADLLLSGMGLASWDLDGDGWLDYCISNVGPAACLLSQDGPTYAEAGLQLGLVPTLVDDPSDWSGWSIEIEDLDNDGRLDAAIAGGAPVGSENLGDTFPDAIFQGEDAGFVDRTDLVGFGDPAHHYGLAAADLDGDGWLDLVLAGAPGPPALWMNRCGAGHWLEVEPVGPPPNTAALGARIVVEVEGGPAEGRWDREILQVRAMGQSPSRVHVGLGEEGVPVRVTVRWPDGTETVVEDPAPDAVLVVPHPAADPASLPAGGT